MAKEVIWSREAVNDIVAIAEFIEKDSEYYASAFVSEIYSKASTLNAFSRRGRIVPEILNEDIREIFIGDYRLIYKIEENLISIIAVIHGSRDLRKILQKEKR